MEQMATPDDSLDVLGGNRRLYDDRVKEKEEKLIWYNEKKQMFKYMFFEPIGLSGYTELFFGKKLYTYDKNQLEKDELATTFFYSLGNKYSQYENQRSNS